MSILLAGGLFLSIAAVGAYKAVFSEECGAGIGLAVVAGLLAVITFSLHPVVYQLVYPIMEDLIPN